MDRLRTLRLFCRIVELGSFSSAARGLGLPSATASTWMKSLENSLGVRLLERSTRKVAVTAEGRAYYERVNNILQDLDEVDESLRADGAELAGRVKIALTGHIMRGVVLPFLPAFTEAHPKLDLSFTMADRPVDLLTENVDLAIRLGTLSNSSLLAKQLASFRLVTLATRELAASAPADPRTLRPEQTIGYRYPPPRDEAGLPFRFNRDGERFEIPLAGRIQFDEFDTCIDAAQAGLGYIQVLWCQAHDAIRRGSLVPVYLDWADVFSPVSLLSLERKNRPRRVEGVMEWLVDIFAKTAAICEQEIEQARANPPG
ncbi:MAG: LysR substrate-binding domain-containing protein [Pseudomonadota bacterium]